MIDKIDYYSQTASGYSLMYSQPIPHEEMRYRYELSRLEQRYYEDKDRLYRSYAPYGDQNGYQIGVYSLEERFYRDKRFLKDQYEEYKYHYYRSIRYNQPVWPSYYPAAMIGGNILYNYSYQFANTKETTKVPTETKKFIIISSAGAASFPKTHSTLAEAEKEATKLAKEFPAQEFTIYKTEKSFKVQDKPVEVKVFV